MNTERLLEVVELLRAEMQANRVYEPLAELSKLVGQRPRGPALDVANALIGKLTNAASTRFTPSRLLIANAIGASRLIGVGLAYRLTTLVSDDRLSPAERATLIQKLSEEVLHFEGVLNNFSAYARHLAIAPLGIPHGACEVGVLYPYPGTVRVLEDLARETLELDAALRSFSEVGGRHGSLELRQLSTSDIGIFMTTVAGVGMVIAKAIDWIRDNTKRTLEIQKLRLEIEEKQIDMEAARRLREREAEIERSGLNATVEGILELYEASDPGRQHELRALLERSLRFMLVKVEQGVIFEVTASDRTSDGVAVNVAAADDGSLGMEARQLAFAREHGAAMRQLAVQRTIELLPGAVPKTARDK